MADAVKSGIVANIHIDGTVVAGMTDCELSIDGEVIETTNKDDSQNRTYLAGRSGWTITGNGFVLLDSVTGTIEAQWQALSTAITTGASVTAKFILPTGSGNSFYDGTAFPTNVTMSGPDSSGFLGNFSLTGTGALTLTDVT